MGALMSSPPKTKSKIGTKKKSSKTTKSKKSTKGIYNFKPKPRSCMYKKH